MLIKLMKGVRQFQRHRFNEMKNVFKQLGKGQHPDILFITCSDSRVIPSLLTQALPGELFVVRNVGGIVPLPTTASSEAAAIEYAIKELHVRDIIVCGHSDCGAIKGLLTPGLKERLSDVSSWLAHSHSVLEELINEGADPSNPPSSLLSKAIKKNILEQIKHLESYPLIAKKMRDKELTLHGWYYEFESGEVFIYDALLNEFITLEASLALTIKKKQTQIVTEVAMNYLEQLSHPGTNKQLHALMQLFQNLKTDLMPIWSDIKEAVTERLWLELGGLYSSPQDSEFSQLVELSSRTQLTDLTSFQKNIQESSAYHQFCNRHIREHLFFKARLPTEHTLSSDLHMTNRIR